MAMGSNIFGCFVSGPSVHYDDDKNTIKLAQEHGKIFAHYIFGDLGLGGVAQDLKVLQFENYGQDFKLILFKFYVNPIKYLLDNIKEIESYRPKEKSIGVPIIVTTENFFSKPENERIDFLKHSIFQKMDLIEKVVKKKKLDTKIDKLKYDLKDVLDNF